MNYIQLNHSYLLKSEWFTITVTYLRKYSGLKLNSFKLIHWCTICLMTLSISNTLKISLCSLMMIYQIIHSCWRLARLLVSLKLKLKRRRKLKKLKRLRRRPKKRRKQLKRKKRKRKRINKEVQKWKIRESHKWIILTLLGEKYIKIKTLKWKRTFPENFQKRCFHHQFNVLKRKKKLRKRMMISKWKRQKFLIYKSTQKYKMISMKN